MSAGNVDFENKVAVVTGGASGIGRATAVAMARLGTDVVLADVGAWTRLGLR